MAAKVSVVKCSSYSQDEVNAAVKRAIELIGGIDIKEGSTVLLKPNVLGNNKPEDCITTHPSVLDAVCRLLKNKKLKLIIGDSSGMGIAGGTKAAMITAGMGEIAKKYGARLMPLESAECSIINNKNYGVLKEISISCVPLKAGYIINLPKLKTHTLVRYTGAVKNMFGVVPGGNKTNCHKIATTEERFAHLLLDIYQNVIPHLTIMDGVYGIEGNGPGSGGRKRKAGIILASKNGIALDFVASKIIGFKPLDIKTNRFALQRKLFDGKIEVLGEKNLSVNFKKPVSIRHFIPPFMIKLVSKQIVAYPEINNEKCKVCMTCVKACPAKTIKMKGKYPFVYKENCINCYCCHELCPYNAINLKRSFIIQLLSKLKNKLKL